MTNTDQNQQPLTADTTRGATILTAYGKRQVKAYPVLEPEIDSLSFFNTLTLVFSSAASACVSFAIGIWTNAAFAEKFTPEGTILAKMVGPAFILFALVLAGLAVWARRSRNSTWTQIKDTTTQH